RKTIWPPSLSTTTVSPSRNSPRSTAWASSHPQDAPLDRALEGSGAIDRVVALVGQQLLGRIRQLQHEVALGQAPAQPTELVFHDPPDLLAREAVEDHDYVDAVEEFGPEVGAQRLGHAPAHLRFLA